MAPSAGMLETKRRMDIIGQIMQGCKCSDEYANVAYLIDESLQSIELKILDRLISLARERTGLVTPNDIFFLIAIIKKHPKVTQFLSEEV